MYNINKMESKLKLIIFGATGNMGRVLVPAALERGFQVSVFARNRAKFERLFAGSVIDQLKVHIGDVFDPMAVSQALAGQEAAVNAAAHRTDRREFENICRAVITAADRGLVNNRRFWQFGGLPGLDVPHTKTMGTDLPFMPGIFKSHKVNYELLKETELDWSFICPGPMYYASGTAPVESILTTLGTMPYQAAYWTKWLPKIAHPFIMRSHLEKLAVSYEDVAAFIMRNMEPDSSYSQKRIGIAYRR